MVRIVFENGSELNHQDATMVEVLDGPAPQVRADQVQPGDVVICVMLCPKRTPMVVATVEVL